MEFREILMMASEQQGLSTVPKRYSLAVGPPKKDPKVKGVQSAAVQAFLRRQEEERRKKALEEKRRKEELLAKRVELKHDRKARAMASRTKDNFHGYNGIPIEEKPKKRQGRESSSDGNIEGAEHMTGDEMEQYEYSQTESEPELEEHEEKPAKASVKPKAPPKSGPPVMNFSDLLKLAEKKQHEPVEIKVVKKTEERPLTAEELREREYLERKNRKGVVVKEKKVEKEMKHTVAPSSSKKEILQKELMNAKSNKHSADKHTFSKGTLSSHSAVDKKSKGPALFEKQSKFSSSSKPSYTEKAKPAAPKGHLKNSTNSSHSKPVSSEGRKSGPNSHTQVLKRTANGTLKQSSAKELNLNKPANHMKPAGVAAAQHESVKISVSKQVSSSSGTGGLLSRAKSSSSTGSGRPSNSLVTGHGSQNMSPGQTALGQRSSGSNMGSDRPGSTLGTRSDRPGSALGPGSARPGSTLGTGSARPGSALGMGSAHPGSALGTGSGRPGGALGTGSGRPGVALGTGSGRPGGALGTGSGRPGGALGTGSGRPGGALGTGSGRLGGALGTGSGRPGSSSGPVRTASSQSVGPGQTANSLNTGMGRNSTLGSGPGRPSSASTGTLKPKCTVVSETISSKNLVPRNSSSQMNGMRPFPQQRPGIPPQGFPRPSLPPITSKRQYEDEDEYDSEMEDFIDDEGEPQEEISKHIREIFGYDRTRYKDESDYALRYMESTWKEQQKEEARSLRLGLQEDLEEMKREEEELKRKKQAKKLRTH